MDAATVGAIAGLASGLAALITVLLVSAQVRSADRSRQIQALLPMYDRFRSESFMRSRYRLARGDFDDFENLSPEDLAELNSLLGYVTLLGLMSEEKLISERIITKVFHRAPADTLDRARRYIEHRRESTPYYARPLESLVERQLRSGRRAAPWAVTRSGDDADRDRS